MTANPGTVGAQLLSRDAHELRNQVATIRSVVRLIDEPEVAQALDDASRVLQVAVERAVVFARVALEEVPQLVELDASELVRLATRRAAREGAKIEVEPSESRELLQVSVPGPWAERLVADLLHHVAGTPGIVRVNGGVRIEVPLEAGGVQAPLDTALDQLAVACGGSLRFADGIAQLHLPLSEG